MQNTLSQKSSSARQKQTLQKSCPFLTQRSDSRLFHLCGKRSFICFCLVEKKSVLDALPSAPSVHYKQTVCVLTDDTNGTGHSTSVQIAQTSAPAQMKQTAMILLGLQQTAHPPLHRQSRGQSAYFIYALDDIRIHSSSPSVLSAKVHCHLLYLIRNGRITCFSHSRQLLRSVCF